MVNNRLAPQFIALVILSSCLPFTKLNSTQDDPTLKLLMGGVGVVVFGCLIKMSYDRSKAETARVDALKQAEVAQAKAEVNRITALEKAVTKPISIIERHGALLDIISQDPVAAQNPASLSETSLRSYTPHFQNQRSSCLAVSIAELSSSIRTINEAVARAHDNNEQKSLKANLQEQKELKERLEIAQECVNTYESFCHLDRMQTHLSKKHAPTIKLLESHPELQHSTQAPTISPALKPFFNTALSVQHASSRQEPNYPYATYVHDSGLDIQQAQEIIKEASNRYPKLAQDTQELINKVTQLHHIARNSTEYHNDRMAYETHQKEQQEFKLKQEHCAELEKIARAAAQTQETIQQSILKTQEERLKTEQARHAIKNERLNIAKKLPDQIKTIAQNQAVLDEKQATAEAAAKTKFACLDKRMQAAKEETENLKKTVTQMYINCNHQEGWIKNAEKILADLESAAQKKHEPKTIITEEPVGPAKADEPVGPGA